MKEKTVRRKGKKSDTNFQKPFKERKNENESKGINSIKSQKDWKKKVKKKIKGNPYGRNREEIKNSLRANVRK